MKSMVSGDEKLDSSIKAFIELGRERNRLVHQNFGTYSIEKTSKEIYELYENFLKSKKSGKNINKKTLCRI